MLEGSGDRLTWNRQGSRQEEAWDASYPSPEGPPGARVQEGEGGNSETPVVGWEGQLCPVQGYQLGPVVVSIERTPGKERSRGGHRGTGCQGEEEPRDQRSTLYHSPVGQDGPLRLLEGAGTGSGPALVQQQDQTGVCPLQEPDLHRDRLAEQPHDGVVPGLIVGAESLICGARGS